MALTQCLFINTSFVNLQALLLSENKQEYMEILHHNFMQCVCTGHMNIEHILSLHNRNYELLHPLQVEWVLID